jgi:acyl-CoA synthetase (AMP-forming)/AMP-acid ligase II
MGITLYGVFNVAIVVIPLATVLTLAWFALTSDDQMVGRHARRAAGRNYR